MKFRVGVISGDGIGPEIVKEAKESEYGYSFSSMGRNVKVRVSAASEQSALDFQNVILDKAEDYLSREYTEAKLSKEAEDMSESVEESPKKKYAALGMLAGLCIGLGGLLAAQYLKSPKIAE